MNLDLTQIFNVIGSFLILILGGFIWSRDFRNIRNSFFFLLTLNLSLFLSVNLVNYGAQNLSVYLWSMRGVIALTSLIFMSSTIPLVRVGTECTLPTAEELII